MWMDVIKTVLRITVCTNGMCSHVSEESGWWWRLMNLGSRESMNECLDKLPEYHSLKRGNTPSSPYISHT
jgi:hypothetical protein